MNTRFLYVTDSNCDVCHSIGSEDKNMQRDSHDLFHHDYRSRRHLSVMRYGSLPLMTYLPDGDIDLVIATFDDNGILQNDEATDSCLEMYVTRGEKKDISLIIINISLSMISIKFIFYYNLYGSHYLISISCFRM